MLAKRTPSRNIVNSLNLSLIYDIIAEETSDEDGGLADIMNFKTVEAPYLPKLTS